MTEQTHPGAEDYEAHFRELLKAFRDRRYLKVDGKPLFIIYMLASLLPAPLYRTLVDLVTRRRSASIDG